MPTGLRHDVQRKAPRLWDLGTLTAAVRQLLPYDHYETIGNNHYQTIRM